MIVESPDAVRTRWFQVIDFNELPHQVEVPDHVRLHMAKKMSSRFDDAQDNASLLCPRSTVVKTPQLPNAAEKCEKAELMAGAVV